MRHLQDKMSERKTFENEDFGEGICCKMRFFPENVFCVFHYYYYTDNILI